MSKEGGGPGALRALLVGIDAYAGDDALRGCVNDVTAMRALLEQRYRARGDDVKVIVDRDATAAAIEAGIGWLSEAPGGGPLLFFYSGHGAFVADESGDEADGKDECLVAADFGRGRDARAGLVVDDTLKDLYEKIGRERHLLLIMDSCHSGGVQKDFERDIAYRFVSFPGEKERAQDAQLRSRRRLEEAVDVAAEQAAKEGLSPAQIKEMVKRTVDGYEKKHFAVELCTGNVTMIAGCAADQQAAEARFGNAYHGAMTHFLLRALGEGVVSYEQLVERVGKDLGARGFTQDPRLECSPEYRAKSFLLP